MNDYTGKICPFCKTEFKPNDDIVVCSECDMPHHKDCWIENQGCTTFGCLGTIKAADNSATTVTTSYMNYEEANTPSSTGIVYCTKCGAQNSATSAFCSKCGNKLAATVEDTPQAPVYTQANPTNNNPYAYVSQQNNYQQANSYSTSGYSAYQPYQNTNIDSDVLQLIGVKTEYYAPKFQEMKNQNKQTSWNWPAFLVTPYWLIYRKMYGYGAAVLAVAFVLSLIGSGLAYVIDPIQNIRGFFQWKNGKIEKLKGYYIYDDIGKPIKIEQIKVDKTTSAQGKPSKLLYAIMAILCAFCIVLCGSLISMKNDYQERLDEQEAIVDDINILLNEQKGIIDEQAKAISTLQGYFVDGILDSSGKTTVEDLISKLENHEIELENQETLLVELKGYLEDIGKEENEVSFKVYTVEKGDSLSSICSKMGIDYSANYKIILSMNGIDDPNKIFAGQNLLLPSVSE